MDPDGGLDHGGDGHDLDCGWPPFLARGGHLCLPGNGVGCRRLLFPSIAKVVTHRVLVPIVVGGLSYSIGAVVNLLHWPATWPGLFGPHECLFHLFVLAGSLVHYMFILKVVVPFVHRPGEVLLEASLRI